MSQLWWYKFLFMTELIIANVMFSFRFEKRRLWGVRAAGAIAACYLLAAFYPLPAAVAYTGWYSSIMFLVMFAAVYGGLMLVYNISPIGGLFCAITAYTIQHMSYELFNILYNVFNFGGFDVYDSGILDFTQFTAGTALAVFVYIDIYILVYGLSYFFIGKKLNLRNNDGIHFNVTLMFFGALILLIDIVLNAFVVYLNERNMGYEIIVGIYNMLCCILVFYFQASMIKTKDMAREITSMSEMLSQSQKQYALTKENVDLINRKCHDLRYQLERMANSGRIDTDELRQINDAISIYDSTVKTGNEVIDLILTDKSLVCREKNIKMTCMADSSGLGYMSESELYALFGNAVDNAIEAVSALGDTDKRCIGLNVHMVLNLVSITIENYFTGNIRMGANGLPLTSQSTDYHGYGMRSMAAIVDKYDGTISVVVDGDIFRLNILLPAKESA